MVSNYIGAEAVEEPWLTALLKKCRVSCFSGPEPYLIEDPGTYESESSECCLGEPSPMYGTNQNPPDRKLFDRIWKSIIEEMFVYFLEFFCPALAKDLDLTRFEFLDKELETIFLEDESISRRRVADKLVKVYRKDGKRECLLIHIEVQGDVRGPFSDRMYRYNNLIRLKYDLPVTAIAITTGSRKAEKFIDLQPLSKIVYDYLRCHVNDHSDEALLKSENPIALVTLAAKKALMIRKMTDEEIMRDFELIARRIESQKLTVDQRSTMYVFLHECVRFKDPENNAKFNHTLETITKRTNPMGIKELFVEIGREEGRQEGRQEAHEEDKRLFTTNLIADGQYSTSKIATLVGVSENYVRKIKRSLKSNSSIS